jgi:uncharacterized protein (DUF58 family)
MFTRRAVLLLLFAAPLLGLAAWSPGMRWVALGYLALALALTVLDWRLAGQAGRFGLQRQHDNRFSLGAENPVTLSLRNPERAALHITVRDEAPEAFQVDVRQFSALVAARQSWQAVYHLRPLRRGDYRFGAINLRWRGPLGLAVRQARLATEDSVKVYPNLLDVRRYDLLLHRSRLQEMGLRQSRRPGQGSEFERLRDYQPDDDFRHINWNATARRHKPVAVQYQTERSQSVMALIDAGRMMQSPVADMAKLDYVINAVLLLAYVVTGKGDKMGLMTFTDNVNQYMNPQAGRGQFYRMLERLYAVEAQPVEPDYGRAISYLMLRHRKRALAVLFTDLTSEDNMRALAGHVATLARHSLPLVVTISDPDIHAAAHQRPQESLDVYRRAAAMQVLDDRRLALEALRRQGVLTLDVPANQLSMGVINRYLELKEKTLL